MLNNTLAKKDRNIGTGNWKQHFFLGCFSWVTSDHYSTWKNGWMFHQRSIMKWLDLEFQARLEHNDGFKTWPSFGAVGWTWPHSAWLGMWGETYLSDHIWLPVLCFSCFLDCGPRKKKHFQWFRLYMISQWCFVWKIREHDILTSSMQVGVSRWMDLKPWRSTPWSLKGPKALAGGVLVDSGWLMEQKTGVKRSLCQYCRILGKLQLFFEGLWRLSGETSSSFEYLFHSLAQPRRIGNAEVFQVPMGWRKASMFFGLFFGGAFVVICCDIRAWFKCCCSQGWQPGMEARHDWLSLDPQKGVWFAKPGNAIRLWGLGPWNLLLYLQRFIGSQVRWSFHTWVGKWSGQPTR